MKKITFSKYPRNPHSKQMKSTSISQTKITPNACTLLVSTNIETITLIENILAERGLELAIVNDSEQAIELALSRDFQIIFFDLTIKNPPTSAIELLRAAGYMRGIVGLFELSNTDYTNYIQAGANCCLQLNPNSSRLISIFNEYLDSNKTKPRIISDKMKAKTKKLAKLFLADLPNKLQLLNNAFNQQDWEILDMVSHKLKGLGGAMGFPEITTYAQAINSLVRNKQFSEIITPLDLLNQYSQTLLKENKN